jgi:hypothetical protein
LDASFSGGQDELDPLGAGGNQHLRPWHDLQDQAGHGLRAHCKLSEPGLLDQGVCQLSEILSGNRCASIDTWKVHDDTMGIGQNLDPRLRNQPWYAEEDLGSGPRGFY